jgi:uncharacterized protein YukE
MSNLQSARAAIQAELQHAMKGAAFYQSQVAALQEALEQLNSIAAAGDAQVRPTKKSARDAGKASAAEKAPAKRSAGRAGSSGLPSTAGDFWKNLIKETPQSAPEVLNAAIAALGVSPNKEDRRRLVQRMVAALNQLVTSGAIKDSGSGRARRYMTK